MVRKLAESPAEHVVLRFAAEGHGSFHVLLKRARPFWLDDPNNCFLFELHKSQILCRQGKKLALSKSKLFEPSKWLPKFAKPSRVRFLRSESGARSKHRLANGCFHVQKAVSKQKAGWCSLGPGKNMRE